LIPSPRSSRKIRPTCKGWWRSSPSVKLTIHNLRGQLLETVVDGYQEAGEHQIIWDASNHSSGVYFYKLTAGDFTETKRMMLVK